MYNVMIVDDENLIIQGLINIIEWEEIGLKVVETSQNGHEALEKFKNNPVDIIVTDISMPKVTGLELIKEVRKLRPKTKFIILTGYDEFVYAKEAIEFGVESYILKPINEEELKDSLVNITKYLDEKKQEKNNILDRNSKLIKYIEEKLNKNYIYNMKDLLSIETENKAYTVANIVITREEKEGSYININEVIQNNTEGNYEILKKYNDQEILINSWDVNISRNEIINYYEKIRDKLSEKYNVFIFISIGSLVFDIKELSESYRFANELKKYILTEGINKCIYKEKLKIVKKTNRRFKEEIEHINKLIIEKNIQEIEKIICDVLDDEELTPENIYNFSIKVVILIDSILNEFMINKKYVDDSLSNTIINLCNERSRKNIKSFIIREIEELVEAMYLNPVKFSPIVQQIVNIISDRYYEDLSLKTLSDEYNINSSYLGQIFSKETESSFSEYLNKTRNIKAKDLILNTNMRINDISNQVGYSDTSYFYRKFKKYYGVSPSTLREMKNY